MSIRESLANNPIVPIVIVVLFCGVAVLLVMRSGAQGTVTIEQVWFYDTANGELFSVAVESTPPIDAPSGSAGVKAAVYTCGSCGSEQEVVYLESYTDDAKKLLNADPETIDNPVMTQSRIQDGRQLAEPATGDGVKWVKATAEAGRALLAKPNTICAGQPGRQCLP